MKHILILSLCLLFSTLNATKVTRTIIYVTKEDNLTSVIFEERRGCRVDTFGLDYLEPKEFRYFKHHLRFKINRFTLAKEMKYLHITNIKTY